jgi:hypothetical protein
LPGLVERAERRPDLPAVRLVDLSSRAAERDDRRPRLFGERRPLDTGASEDERTGRRVHPFAVELERRAATVNEVELLARVVVGLVMLVDDPVARGPGRPCVDAEGRDAEVLPDRPPRTAAVGDLVDLVKVRHCVHGHRTS